MEGEIGGERMREERKREKGREIESKRGRKSKREREKNR